MSEHLLPVKTGNEQFPVTYRNIGYGVDSYYCGITYEHNAMLFCLKQNHYNSNQSATYNGKAFIDVINLFTGDIRHYAELDYFTDLDQSDIGGIVVDDNYLYISNAWTNTDSYRRIFIFKLKDWSSPSLQLERVGAYKYSGGYYAATGKLIQCDRNTLVSMTRTDLILFDINHRAYIPYAHGFGNDIRDYAVGNKYIVITKDANSTPNVRLFNRSTKEFTSVSLPTTGVASVGYYGGKYFFANANYLYIMDEETLEILTTKNIPWTKAADLCVSDHAVYVIQDNSAYAYIYDYEHDETQKFMLSWTIPTTNTSNITRCCVSENFWFIYRNTLMSCDYSGYSKYNFGYKYESIVVLCNISQIQKFTYDSRFVTFTETFMFVHDGDLEYTFEPVEDQEHIKSVSISKSDYRFINSIQFKSE